MSSSPFSSLALDYVIHFKVRATLFRFSRDDSLLYLWIIGYVYM